jgi:aspartyl-tRNA(Asn)/glutamyl-tRNA(Gln) amidotransferase subunit A
MEDLIYSSATSLARAIREKEVSSSEVVNAHIERIEAINPKLNA